VLFIAGAEAQKATDEDKSIMFKCGYIASVLATKHESGWKVTSLETHKNIASFWSMLHDMIPDKTRLLVFGHDLIPQLSLSGFWRWVDACNVWFPTTPIKQDGKDTGQWYGSLVLSNPPNYVTCRMGAKTMRVIDIRNYVNEPLGYFIEASGNELLSAVTRLSSGDRNVRYDLEVCYAIANLLCKWLDWWGNGNNGVWQPTAARLAMNSYRHWLDRQRSEVFDKLVCGNDPKNVQEQVPFVVFNDDEKVRSLARKAYIGGRAEVYRTGEIGEQVYYVDCRSMYPYLAANIDLPFRWLRTVINPSSSYLIKAFPNVQSVARVRVHCEQPIYPVRITKHFRSTGDTISLEPHDNSKTNDEITIFPTGQFDTVLCGDELRFAIDEGHILKIYEANEYQCQPILSDWMYAQYAERCNADKLADKPLGQLCKILMNSLIGKWGSMSQRWNDRPDIPAATRYGTMVVHNCSSNATLTLRFIAGHTQSMGERKEIFNAMPEIPAFVCSAGRQYLWLLMNSAGLNNVIFCNTDGFVVTGDGMNRLYDMRLIGNDDWGCLRVIASSGNITVYSPTHYWWGNSEVFAGVPKNRLVTVSGEMYSWSNDHIPDDPSVSVPFTFKVRLLSHQPRSKYIGRRIKDDGFTTPWSI